MLEADPELKTQVVRYLEEHPELGEFTSSWLSSELGADDLRLCDSDDQDIHVVYVLEELVEEARVSVTLWGECACGADGYRTEEQGSPTCLSCGHEIHADTPVYCFLPYEPVPFVAPRRPRLRTSALAERR